MVSVKWCLQQKNGLELIESNATMADSYLNMAEKTLPVQQAVLSSDIWTATTTYYIFYYSLYALMLRIGIKCEIHSCSIAFMKEHLIIFYNKKDDEMLDKAFSARIDLQYYADRPVDAKIIEETRKHSKIFYIKTKDAIAKITEEQIASIREALNKDTHNREKNY